MYSDISVSLYIYVHIASRFSFIPITELIISAESFLPVFKKKQKDIERLSYLKKGKMGMHFRDKAWIFLAILCFSSLIWSTEAVVTYDHKALIINGQRRILISGSIHYPRSTPEVISNYSLISLFSYMQTFLVMNKFSSGNF